MMKQFLRDYFSFNKKERNGIAVLLFLLAVLLTFLVYLKKDGADTNEKGLEVRKWDAAIGQKDTIGEDSPHEISGQRGANETRDEVVNYFYFDPNRIGEREWIRLGMPEKLARTLSHYVSKGGVFRKKEDLKKIYGLSSAQYAKLEPFVRIPPDTSGELQPVFASRNEHNFTPSPKAPAKEQVELNTADSTSLVSLPCIGPSFARRIVIYRSRLGGFVSERQLMEVYGFDEERLKCLEGRFLIDTEKIKGININSASAEELKKHPYFNWSLAKLMVAYRKQHGMFHSAEELRGLQLMDSALFRRIAPYIRL
ncbi:MAG TPA: helix-hairpin-helix domain-containing protein [Bacteroidia bacterium]|jgi:DNA uptake protein ComE-like DNA-binding protein|nr:helix-hairpin-helix domain-containing protein [Bacteroidia bacterium]